MEYIKTPTLKKECLIVCGIVYRFYIHIFLKALRIIDCVLAMLQSDQFLDSCKERTAVVVGFLNFLNMRYAITVNIPFGPALDKQVR